VGFPQVSKASGPRGGWLAVAFAAFNTWGVPSVAALPLPSGVVALVGSRSLSGALGARVGPVVRSLLGSGLSVAVGCSVGADQAVLSAALAWLSGRPAAAVFLLLRVFAVFGPGGAGAVAPVSSVPSVLAAVAAGASVVWSAGGPPSLPARVRLARRSACLVSAVASGCGLGGGRGSLVCFLASPLSRGSLLSCRLAAGFGLPVLVLAAFAGPPPLLAAGGSWSPCSCCGLWSPSWRWVPAPPLQARLF